MRPTDYILDPVTLRMVPAPPRRWKRLLKSIAGAVASMTAMWKYIK